MQERRHQKRSVTQGAILAAALLFLSVAAFLSGESSGLIGSFAAIGFAAIIILWMLQDRL